MMIEISLEDGVATVVLNRPEKLNALTVKMREELRDTFAGIRADPAARAVLLTARGRGFCAGADVAELDGNDTRYDFDVVTNPMILNLASIEKPVVCAVNGLAVGLGWSLALCSDIILAGESARFSMIFSKIGLAPDGGAAWFLNRMVGPLKARDLIFSARMLDAREAGALGLVTDVVADDDLMAAATARARALAAGPTLALCHTKSLLDASIAPGLADHLAREADLQCELTKSRDHAEALIAFRDKREPVFAGT